MNEELKRCTNELCSRKVRITVVYCCHPCDMAHERGYEIHSSGILGHTDECNSRHAKRGDWKDEWSDSARDHSGGSGYVVIPGRDASLAAGLPFPSPRAPEPGSEGK